MILIFYYSNSVLLVIPQFSNSFHCFVKRFVCVFKWFPVHVDWSLRVQCGILLGWDNMYFCCFQNRKNEPCTTRAPSSVIISARNWYWTSYAKWIRNYFGWANKHNFVAKNIEKYFWRKCSSILIYIHNELLIPADRLP